MTKLITLLKTTSLGTKVMVLSLSAIISVLISMKVALSGLILIIILDLITGISKNLYNQGKPFNPLKLYFWKSIKSYLLRRTWKKGYEYGLGIIVVLIFDTMVWGGDSRVMLVNKIFTFSELSVIIASGIEIWSIGENIEEITGSNFIKRFTRILPYKMQKIVNKKDVKK